MSKQWKEALQSIKRVVEVYPSTGNWDAYKEKVYQDALKAIQWAEENIIPAPSPNWKEILSDQWVNKTPMFLPKDMTEFIMFQKQAFEAGLSAAPSIRWVKELLKKQREICAKAIKDEYRFKMDTYWENLVKNAPEPKIEFLEEPTELPAPSLDREDFVTSDGATSEVPCVTPFKDNNSIEHEKA